MNRLTNEERAWRREKEADVCRTVEAALTAFGYRWTHFRPAKTDKGWRTPLTGDRGFVDYVCVRGNRLIFIETKRELGKLEPEQEAWRDALMPVAEWHLVKPSTLSAFLEVLK